MPEACPDVGFVVAGTDARISFNITATSDGEEVTYTGATGTATFYPAVDASFTKSMTLDADPRFLPQIHADLVPSDTAGFVTPQRIVVRGAITKTDGTLQGVFAKFDLIDCR